ncbi:MAG: ash family protein [Enterobacter hormaechei]
MVGWTGALKGAPVSDNAGCNPVRFTTSEIGVSGGEGNSLLSRLPSWLLSQPSLV